MKILYIEDDTEDRDLFHEAISLASHEIDIDFALDCEEALFKLKTQKQPDLIFLDISLPLRSGLDCLIAIKTNPLLTGIPVIIYSSSKDKRDIMKCMELGATKYLAKPNDFDTLCKELKFLLGVKQEKL